MVFEAAAEVVTIAGGGGRELPRDPRWSYGGRCRRCPDLEAGSPHYGGKHCQRQDGHRDYGGQLWFLAGAF